VALFLSTFTNKIDGKGRVSVPAPFRAAMVGQGWNGVIAFPSFVNNCIEGCDLAYMERLSQSIDEFAPFSDEHDGFITSIVSKSHQLSFDSGGRIQLPQKLIDHAALGEQATFVGRGKTFQVWEPEAYAAFEDRVGDIAFREREKLRLPGLAGPER